jgi:hypothetical protein
MEHANVSLCGWESRVMTARQPPAPRQTSQTVGAISGEGCFSVLRIREHAEAAHNEGYRKGGPIGGLLRLRPRALLPLKMATYKVCSLPLTLQSVRGGR